MIKTVFIEGFDYAEHIPNGSKIGLIGCSDCAAVFRTADSKTMEAVKEKLLETGEIVFCISLDSPCDQRMLRQAILSIPDFDCAEYIVILACEAGSRSLGTLLLKQNKNIRVISPLKTSGYKIIQTDNTHSVPCVFCDTCLFPDKSTLCPVAECPMHRTDGPCQNRVDKECILDSFRECSWLRSPKLNQDNSTNCKCSNVLNNRCCFLLPPFKTLEHLRSFSALLKKSSIFSLRQKPLFFLQGGADALEVSAQALFLLNDEICGDRDVSKYVSGYIGITLDYTRINFASLCGIMNTANAINCKFLFLKEPSAEVVTYPSNSAVLSKISSLDLIKESLKINRDFIICSQNMFSHSADVKLSENQCLLGVNHIFKAPISSSKSILNYSDFKPSNLYNLENYDNLEIASIVKAMQ